jgi:hypothetical protein
MLFHFQFRGTVGWEAIGAGVGDGEDPIAEALAEVRRFAGGTLPAGNYQAIEARSSDTRWEAFDLGEDGQIVWGRDPGSAAEAARSSCGEETAGEFCPR